MKNTFINPIFVMAMTLSTVSIAQAQVSKDEQQIRNIIDEMDVTWNQGDVAGYSKPVAAEVTFTNIRGEFVVGREVFEQKHDLIFKTFFKGTVLKQNIASLKFVSDDVAIVETICWVSGITEPNPGMKLDPKGRLVTRLLQVMRKENSEWKIYSYHNIMVGPGVVVGEPQ